MPAIVSSTETGSIAEELELENGDILLSIDGQNLMDMIDYNFYCKSEYLTLEIQKTNGEIEEIELEKDFDEELGIIFESAVFDKIKPCLNKCIFCFVDQQPKGLRDTLYVKDDDYRLSYLQGTYITLTNFKEVDKERILRMHLGPFYVSVHTTNPELRVSMLKNPKAGEALKHLDWFNKNDIPFHAQIVLCPEINDGKELDRTLKDLSKYGENLLSVAIVPVGITQFREGNILKKVSSEVAKETIQIASKYEKVCCSDEFFLLADVKIPQKEYYGTFCQLDDGVGAIRAILEDFKTLDFPKVLNKELKLCFATSYAGYGAIKEISNELNKIKNLECSVTPVKSNYWGEGITVAGLITSADLIETIKDVDADFIIVPSIMLKPYSDSFLDGETLASVKQITKKEFIVITEQYSLRELEDFIADYSLEN